MSENEFLTPKDARALLLEGLAPDGVVIKGHLDLSGTGISQLPNDMRVDSLNLSGCANLEFLPFGLSCYELEARNIPIESLPHDLRVEYRLDLTGCFRLRSLPENFQVGSLVLERCTSLEYLPEGLDVYFLNINDCTRLREFPMKANIRVGRISAQRCTQLRTLPDWMSKIAQLDVRGCVNLETLPDRFEITSWIDVAGTQLKRLPKASENAQIRWRGVPINERIAFQPESITSKEILEERNVELRRVLLERMGYESFLSEANAKTIDEDTDPGGIRRLLRMPMQNDEDLVCLTVLCPSTARQYIIRVPPNMRTCRQAAAWIAGFEDPELYNPIHET